MSSYENPWIIDDKAFESEDIEGYYGFVYLIVNKTNGRKYLGRKYFYNLRKAKGKKNRVKSESDWKKYYGSSDDLLEDIKKFGNDNFERYIMSLHITKGDTNYEEVKQQFVYNVLEEDGWYNANISGKYRRKPKHISEGRRYNERIHERLISEIRHPGRRELG